MVDFLEKSSRGIMRGPAMPRNTASGSCCFTAAIKAAPSISPDASPATMPIRMLTPRAQQKEIISESLAFEITY